ncbi:hypothetical protein DPMN_179578 [Dreissena polymorpha]|uniref:Uncharacterized protein n=1 Tax=Dreissena polymorpha TaxID=45954 RepID=A0A9D4EHB8_DREPO|nr:hypothetical protein DPMN_179578 [Dreissena polymorpha]
MIAFSTERLSSSPMIAFSTERLSYPPMIAFSTEILSYPPIIAFFTFPTSLAIAVFSLFSSSISRSLPPHQLLFQRIQATRCAVNLLFHCTLTPERGKVHILIM